LYRQAHSILRARAMMTRMPSFVPGVGHMSMRRTSLQTTYMMPPTYWRLWMSGHLWSQRLLSWTLHSQWVLLARDSLVWLGGSLCLGEAVFQISVLSSSCGHTAISICCNDSRHCHAKEVIFILHGYI